MTQSLTFPAEATLGTRHLRAGLRRLAWRDASGSVDGPRDQDLRKLT
jgi:hypothetical protein